MAQEKRKEYMQTYKQQTEVLVDFNTVLSITNFFTELLHIRRMYWNSIMILLNILIQNHLEHDIHESKISIIEQLNQFH